jgi:hypothetical protein
MEPSESTRPIHRAENRNRFLPSVIKYLPPADNAPMRRVFSIEKKKSMDVNFKQSMKGVANALPALRPGGTIMAFLRAERGLDDIVLPE